MGKYKKKKCREDKHFSWVSDIVMDKSTIKKIVKGGRNRWMIENEVFNALKNNGYNYDRNYGHGYKNLSNNFATLMMLAFTFDQILEMNSKNFKAILRKLRIKKDVWEKIRFYFEDYLIKSWDFLLEFLINSNKVQLEINYNSS